MNDRFRKLFPAGRTAVVMVAGVVVMGAILLLALAGGDAGAAVLALLSGGLGLVAGHWVARGGERRAVGGSPVRTGEPSAVPWAILERLPDPVVLIDARRFVLAANQLARDLLGAEMVGRHLARSFRHPVALQAVDRVLAGESRVVVELSLPVPLRRFFTFHVFDLAREGGTPPSEVAAMLILHEMTAAKRAEQMRADFVANVSHELRSPLAAVIGFIETLKGPARDDEAARHRFLDIMDREAGRMARLINDLLSLARVEANEHVRPGGEVEIGLLLGRVAETLSLAASERNMAVEVDVPDDLPRVQGDGDELVQVLHNLIDNAIKYGREGTAIRVRARAVDRIPEMGGKGVAVAVIDRGEGISQDQLGRLTERFYRTDKARSRALGGTGLGLAIVKHIVSHHRGRLTIESVEGEGSTVTVFLPGLPQDIHKDGPPPS